MPITYDRKSIRHNMTAMLRESKNEYKMYNDQDPDTVVYLQQAGEKLFNAFERYLELKQDMVIYGMKDARSLALRQNDEDLFSTLSLLHDYFYHGNSIDIDPEQIRMLYLAAHGKVETKINNL